MTASSDLQAYIAGNKFGLGLRPGEAAHIRTDPRGWLHQQLKTITQLPPAYSSVEASGPILLRSLQSLRKLRQAVDAGGVKPPEQQTATNLQSEDKAKALRQTAVTGERESRLEQREQLATRMRVALTTTAPFAERLVRFWSNHFTVAEGGAVKKTLRQIAVPYENEAIRANLNGSFADLLLAVEQHPAMLIYLDNIASLGPESVAGKRGKDRGLNENLAREILELHTLGVNGGYTQQDVTTLAKIITGWTVGSISERPLLQANPGRFLYVDLMHEPGSQTLLGKRYRDSGVNQGKDALRDLATHPATARHIATKLARHFVADQPPPSAVATLEQVFRDTNGNLPSVHAALITLEPAWQDDQRKLKTPEELVISVGRALNLGEQMTSNPRKNDPFAFNTMDTFAQVPFTASSPAGWSDLADYWGSSDALLKRIEWATAVATRLGGNRDALALYADLLPEQAELKQELSRAESNSQALAMLVASPQFQWR